MASSRLCESRDRRHQPVALDLQFGKFGAQIVERDETHEGAAAGHPALAPPELRRGAVSTTMSKLAAWLAQAGRSPCSSSHAERGFSQRPKARKFAVVLRRAGFGRQLAEQFGACRSAVPDDDPAVLVGDQRLIVRNALAARRTSAERIFAAFGFHDCRAGAPAKGSKADAAEMTPITTEKLTTRDDEEMRRRRSLGLDLRETPGRASAAMAVPAQDSQQRSEPCPASTRLPARRTG